MRGKSLTRLDLRRLAHSLREKMPPSWLEAWAPLAKIVVVLTAAVWTLTMYLSHERSFQSLLNEHQRLANEQLRFTIQQAEANAAYDIARAKLAAETAALQNELLRRQIREQTANGVYVAHDIQVTAIGTRRDTYSGTFEISLENASKQTIEISWAAFELYIGQMIANTGREAITYINPPPNRELDQTSPAGPLRWEHQVTYGHLYPSSALLKYDVFKPYAYYKLGGPLMKKLSSGESTKFVMPLAINAPRDRWIAVVTSIGMDGSLSGDKVYNTADWIDLQSARTPQ